MVVYLTGYNIRKVILFFSCFVLIIIVNYDKVHQNVGKLLEKTENCGRGKNNSFSKGMMIFPWKEYSQAIDTKNLTQIQHYSTNLIHKIVPYLIMPPKIPIDHQCFPPFLQIPHGINCSKLAKPRKVGILLQFGFDVDALEIHFHELDDFVDKFFIVEAVQTHSIYTTQKPLVWDWVKFQERFAKFLPKVVHFVIDDVGLVNVKATNNAWSRENKQEELRWKKFLEWNKVTKYFDSQDLLGFGDADEVPNRNNVYFLKFCEMPSVPVDIGLWFPMNGPNTIYSSDFPVVGHKYTYADPTFWTLEAALNYVQNVQTFPTRLRGKSRQYLLGGMHLSRNTYTPHIMAKYVTMSSSESIYLNKAVDIGLLYAANQYSKAETKSLELPKEWLSRTWNLKVFEILYPGVAAPIVKVPWFLNCNWARYPNFNNERDSRLDE